MTQSWCLTVELVGKRFTVVAFAVMSTQGVIAAQSHTMVCCLVVAVNTRHGDIAWFKELVLFRGAWTIELRTAHFQFLSSHLYLYSSIVFLISNRRLTLNSHCLLSFLSSPLSLLSVSQHSQPTSV